LAHKPKWIGDTANESFKLRYREFGKGIKLEFLVAAARYDMTTLELKQSIIKFANRDWESVAAAVEQAHRTETIDARISASAAIAASIRALGRFDTRYEMDDIAALGRVLTAFQRVNSLA